MRLGLPRPELAPEFAFELALQRRSLRTLSEACWVWHLARCFLVGALVLMSVDASGRHHRSSPSTPPIEEAVRTCAIDLKGIIAVVSIYVDP